MKQIAPVGIVAALDAEARSCAAWQKATGALMVVTGPGPARAASGARALVEAGISSLVSWGTSGALLPGLDPGRLLLISTTGVLGGERYPADPTLLNRILTVLMPLAPWQADACSVAVPISGQHARTLLASRSGSSAVDMESAAVAEVAQEAGVPFLGIRAIVDPLAFELPAAALAGMGEDGRSYPWRVAMALLRRPSELGSLIRLGLHFSAALRTLTRAARTLAEEEARRPEALMALQR